MSRTLASATPGADIVVKAGADGKIAQGFLPDTSRALFSGLMSAVPTQLLTGFDTWVNQGTATISDDSNGLTLHYGGSDAYFHGIYKSVPSTPYTITVLIVKTSILNANYPGVNFGWYDNSTGKFQVFYWAVHSSVYGFFNVSNFSSYTSGASNVSEKTYVQLHRVWLRLKDDGSTVYFQYSFDGVHFITHYSVTKSSGYLGSIGSSGYSKVYFGVSNVNSYPIYAVIESYAEA